MNADGTAANIVIFPDQSLAAALHTALRDQSLGYVLHVQSRRGAAAPDAVELGLTLERGDLSLQLARQRELIAAEGLRVRLDHYAIRAACRYLAGPDAAGRAAVKVDGETLARGGCAALVEDAAASHGIEHGRLELEIEEHVLHWRDDIQPTLKRLAELGVRVAIDRFGTGLTSLSTLSHLPIATIKLDESIVVRVLHDVDVANYARAIVDVARHLRIDVVVMGAADGAARAFFEGAGCSKFQQ